jgi:hypothetical protein
VNASIRTADFRTRAKNHLPLRRHGRLSRLPAFARSEPTSAPCKQACRSDRSLSPCTCSLSPVISYKTSATRTGCPRVKLRFPTTASCDFGADCAGVRDSILGRVSGAAGTGGDLRVQASPEARAEKASVAQRPARQTGQIAEMHPRYRRQSRRIARNRDAPRAAVQRVPPIVPRCWCGKHFRS